MKESNRAPSLSAKRSWLSSGVLTPTEYQAVACEGNLVAAFNFFLVSKKLLGQL